MGSLGQGQCCHIAIGGQEEVIVLLTNVNDDRDNKMDLHKPGSDESFRLIHPAQQLEDKSLIPMLDPELSGNASGL